jgi:beta-lactam-binding protein with PASTA domain
MIYITVASKNPPEVDMPDFITKITNLKQAEIQLKQLDLVLANVIPVPGENDRVLDQLVNGKRIQPQTRIPKGTKITLKVGKSDGESVEIPDFTQGWDVNSVRGYCQENGLTLQIYPEGTSEGTIVKQRPRPEETAPRGSIVDIWVE